MPCERFEPITKRAGDGMELALARLRSFRETRAWPSWRALLDGMVARTWLATLFIAVLGGVLLFPSLGYPLLEPDEGRYGEIAREMVRSGDWIVPQLNYQPYLEKPPLFYWLVACSYRLFGTGEASARLVPTLAAWLTMLLVHAFGRHVFGARAGFLATMTLALCAGFVQCGRILILDSLLTLWVTAALCTGYLACQAPRVRWRWWLVSAVCCGMGVMTKGLIAFVLVVPPLFVVNVLARRRLHPTVRAWLAFGGMAVAIAMPWHAAVTWRDPTFLWFYFVRHHVDRFVAGTFHDRPFWFYVPVLLVGGLPWSFLVPGLLRRARQAWLAKEPNAHAIILFLSAAGWNVIFFTMSRGKLPSYVLPAAPMLTLALGWYLAQRMDQPPRPLVAWLGGSMLVAILMGSLVWSYREGMAWTSVTLAQAVLVLLAGAALLLRRDNKAFVGTLVLAVGAVSLSGHVLVPAYSAQRVPWAHDHAILGMMRDERVSVACYGREWGSLPFYLNRDDVANFTRRDWTELQAYLRAHPHTVLITKSTQSPESMAWSLSPGAQMEHVAHLGDINVFRVTTP